MRLIRRLAAAVLGTLKTKPIEPVTGAFPCPVSVKLDFTEDDRKLCPAFALRLVRGVKNGPSPDWLQARLRAVGLGELEILDLVLSVAIFGWANRLMHTLGEPVTGSD